MSIYALIPARGGSKGIPKKNIKIFNGKPLISWTIIQAIKSQCFDKVIVSTNCNEIAKIAINYGAEVPYIRKEELSKDNSKIIDTIIDFIDRFPGLKDLMLLQPTSPLRSVNDIKNIINLRKELKKESAVSVTKVTEHPEWMYKISDANTLTPYKKNSKIFNRRQDLESLYILNGSMYLSSKNFLKKNKRLVSEETIPYLMNKDQSIDIDDFDDWNYGEFLIRQSNLD